jgi:SPP1 gp7 family putative phage head morphogenesis protein
MAEVKTDRFPRPVEAERLLERRVNTPTDKWDDLKWGEHSHAFTVAHSCEADILDDIHGLLNKAMSSGDSFQTFRDGMLDAMEKTGWYGGAGHTKDDKEYINWRIKIIYDTNMRTAYAAARYRRQLQDAESRPIWVYLSKVVGANRRPEHIELHGKAFRYDDPFWDTYYPPNGWGCECSVTTKSESGAKREGITVEDSGGMDLPDIDPTWSYNPGREALAPNFAKFTGLCDIKLPDQRTAYTHVVEQYRKDMDGTRMTAGEFDTLVSRINRKDYTPTGVNYQVGNLESQRFEVIRDAGIMDSKIMATDGALYHSIANKDRGPSRQKADQKIPDDQQKEIYPLLQNPESIFEEIGTKRPRQGRIFHFVKDMHDGKVIKILLEQRNGSTALRIVTMGKIAKGHYRGTQYKKIW